MFFAQVSNFKRNYPQGRFWFYIYSPPPPFYNPINYHIHYFLDMKIKERRWHYLLFYSKWSFVGGLAIKWRTQEASTVLIYLLQGLQYHILMSSFVGEYLWWQVVMSSFVCSVKRLLVYDCAYRFTLLADHLK